MARGGGSQGGDDEHALLTPVVPGAVPGDTPLPDTERPVPVLSSRHDAISEEDSEDGDGESRQHNFKQRVHLFVDDPDSSVFARCLSHIILYTIVLSILSFILQTVPTVQAPLPFKPGLFFNDADDEWNMWTLVDIVSTTIFTLEYFTRLWACNAFGETNRLDWVKMPMNILDLLSILPTYLVEDVEALKPFRVLRAVRLIRIFRVFKLSKYSSGMNLMVESLYNSARPLWILGFFLGNGVVLFSSMLYYAEKSGCPDVAAMSPEYWLDYRRQCNASDSTGWTVAQELCCTELGVADKFESIPATFWWTIVTMTTVGYGDLAPRTLQGQLVGGLAMISGIMLISLPVAIVGSKFQQAYEIDERKKADEKRKAAQEAQYGQQYHSESGMSKSLSQQYNREASDAALLQKAAGLLKKNTIPNFNPAGGGGGGMLGNLLGPTQTATDQRLQPLKAKLQELETKRRMSLKAQSQIALLFELFEHIEDVEARLAALQDKDATVDVCIRSHFTSLSRSYNEELKAAQGN